MTVAVELARRGFPLSTFPLSPLPFPFPLQFTDTHLIHYKYIYTLVLLRAVEFSPLEYTAFSPTRAPLRGFDIRSNIR